MNETEANLIVRAKQREPAAFEALMHLHEKAVYNMALRMTRSRDDAFDVSQEVFLRVWQSLDSFKEESSFSTWLYRITYNLCVDHARREQKRRDWVSLSASDGDGDEYELPVRDPSATPEELAERREMLDAYRDALAQLPEDYRAVLVLRDLGERSYNEIAEVTGTSLGTVKSRINRARSRLLAVYRGLRGDL